MSGLDKHKKERGSHFTIVTNDDFCRDNIKKAMPDFPSWGWIDHVPDDDEGKPHTHFVFRTNGSRTVAQVADRLEISPQYVQVVRKLTAMYRYFVHADDPDKHQYSLDDVHTNHINDFRIALEGNDQKDVYTLYRDYKRLCDGRISVSEFIEQNYVEFNRMAFSQKIKTFEILAKHAHDTT